MMARTTSRKGSSSAATLNKKKREWSVDVAPATMFQYDRGLNNTEVAVRTTKLLSTRAYAISDPMDGNQASSLTSNVVRVS